MPNPVARAATEHNPCSRNHLHNQKTSFPRLLALPARFGPAILTGKRSRGWENFSASRPLRYSCSGMRWVATSRAYHNR